MNNRILHPDVSGQSEGPNDHLCFYLNKASGYDSKVMPADSSVHAYFSLSMALADLLSIPFEQLDPEIGRQQRQGYFEYNSVYGRRDDPQYGQIICHRPEFKRIDGPFGIYFTSEFSIEQLVAATGMPFPSNSHSTHPYRLRLATYNEDYTGLIPTDSYLVLKEWVNQYYAATAMADFQMDYELVLKGQQRSSSTTVRDIVVHQYFDNPMASLRTLLHMPAGLFDEGGIAQNGRYYENAYLINDRKEVSGTLQTIPIPESATREIAGICIKTPGSLLSIAGDRTIDIPALPSGNFDAIYKVEGHIYAKGDGLETVSLDLGVVQLQREGNSSLQSGDNFTLVCNYRYQESFEINMGEAIDAYHYPRLEQALFKIIHLDLPSWHCLVLPDGIPFELRQAEIIGAQGMVAALRMSATQEDGGRHLCLVLSKAASFRHSDILTKLSLLEKSVAMEEPVDNAIIIPIGRYYQTLGLRPYPHILADINRVVSRAIGYSLADLVNWHQRVNVTEGMDSLPRRWIVELHFQGSANGEVIPAAILPLSSLGQAHQLLLDLPDQLFTVEPANEHGRSLQKAILWDQVGAQYICSRYYHNDDLAQMPTGIYVEYNKHSPFADALAADIVGFISHGNSEDQQVRIYRQDADGTGPGPSAIRRNHRADGPAYPPRRRL